MYMEVNLLNIIICCCHVQRESEWKQDKDYTEWTMAFNVLSHTDHEKQPFIIV